MSELATFIHLGFRHIVDISAMDHILFLLALAAIYRFKDWRSTLWVVTAFTVGHSITLALAVTGVLTISPSLVEFLIPLTIMLTAVENIVVKDRGGALWNGRYRPVFAGVFGLVHGAGFASYLKSLFVDHVALPLFGFNVGIEIGQVVVLIAAFSVLYAIDYGISAASRGCGCRRARQRRSGCACWRCRRSWRWWRRAGRSSGRRGSDARATIVPGRNRAHGESGVARRWRARGGCAPAPYDARTAHVRRAHARARGKHSRICGRLRGSGGKARRGQAARRRSRRRCGRVRIRNQYVTLFRCERACDATRVVRLAAVWRCAVVVRARIERRPAKLAQTLRPDVVRAVRRSDQHRAVRCGGEALELALHEGRRSEACTVRKRDVTTSRERPLRR